MSTILTEKIHSLTLKFACCKNSFMLCPLVVDKLPFERKLVTLLLWILIKDLE